MTINYSCSECDHAFELDISYFDGRLDSTDHEKCPKCGDPITDEDQIDETRDEVLRDMEGDKGS